MEEFLESLPEIEMKGVAVDIDDTLSNTVNSLVPLMLEKFGSPEDLTSEEIVEKYGFVYKVPYWRSEEARDFIQEATILPEVMANLPVVFDSAEKLSLLSEKVPVVCYITARSDEISDVTKTWLKKNGFPDAPVISRPRILDHSKSNLWKARVLERLYPNVIGIIDDNEGVLKHFNDSYLGKVFLYSHDKYDHSLCVPCYDWDRVIEEVGGYWDDFTKT